MPFGAVAAVYAWDRVGGALQHILQQMFLLPASRYVDDLFWCDFSSTASHGRALALQVIDTLGFTLAIDKTPPPSASQDILGVTLILTVGQGRLCLHLPSGLRAARRPPRLCIVGRLGACL